VGLNESLTALEALLGVGQVSGRLPPRFHQYTEGQPCIPRNRPSQVATGRLRWLSNLVDSSLPATLTTELFHSGGLERSVGRR